MTIDNTTVADGNQPNIRLPKATQIKQYIATLSQTGTENPVATVLHNTLGNIIWTRESKGLYGGTLTNGFPEQKTTMPPFSGQGGVINLNTWNGTPNDYSYIQYRNDNNKVYITVIKNSDASFADLSEAVGAPILITINVYEENTIRTPTPTPTPHIYKVYTAQITQSSTNNPTVTILQNTIGNIIWTRDAMGEYTGTLTGAFEELKTWQILSPNYVHKTYAIGRSNDDAIYIFTENADGTESDDLLQETPIEIRVYN